ncbi:MAG: cytochrome P450 [Henriciella sp.]|nr:cytochrome P450 [Henriciella sp.]
MTDSPFKDAFKTARAETGVLTLDVDGEPIPLILRYRDVRLAAKNWQTYSSDAPFRVPVPSEEDVRSVRQLPIETDPPRHTQVRALLEPVFRQPQQPDYIQRIEALVNELVDQAAAGEPIEVVRDFALPLQSRALTYLLNMPEAEADIWAQWGTHVFRDAGDGGTGTTVDRYIRTQLTRAARDENGEDFFCALRRMQLDRRPLNEDEMMGIANLTFAGGRDTIINAVSVMVAYFAEHPEHFIDIADDQRQINLATEEFVRLISPLTFIGRVCPHETDLGSTTVAADGRVGLCWASANYDETVFEAPEDVRLDRSPNPHVGFGSGHHTCLGAHQARVIMRSLIKALASRTGGIEIIDATAKTEDNGEYARWLAYDSLIVKVLPQ